MKIIDFRCRPPFGNFKKDWIFNLEDTPESEGLITKYRKMSAQMPKSLLCSSMDLFFQECADIGIYLNVVPIRRLAFLNNKVLVELLKRWPDRFIGFAGLSPMQQGLKSCKEEIDNFVIDGPCKGIYLEPGLDDPAWEIDSEKFYPIYDKCEKCKIPLMILFGGVFHKKNPPLYNIYHPERIERLAGAFPDLKIMLAHAGWPFAAQTCAVALNYKNIWLCPDGFMLNHPASQDFVVAANYRLQDKIVFGSLYPAMSPEYAVNEYKRLLREDVREKVFFKNGAEFLDLG